MKFLDPNTDNAMKDSFRKMKDILVIGETCTDEFVYGIVDRISQESPSPIFLSSGKKISYQGMCSNVAANVRSISKNVNVSVVTNKDPIIKRRFIDSRHNVMTYRIDENDSTPRIDMSSLIPYLTSDAVIVSDYDKGFISHDDLEHLVRLFDCPKFIDTKKIVSEKWAKGFDFIKINSDELFANLASHGTIEALLDVCNELIVTSGSEGATLYSKGNEKRFSGHNVKVSQVSGAGDTFLSGLATRFLETKDIEDAIKFANICSAIAVSKENISVVNRTEVNNFGKGCCSIG